MTCILCVTVRSRVRFEKYKSLSDLAIAYEGVQVKFQPAWAYDERGTLILGAEPEGFERPAMQTFDLPNTSTISLAAENLLRGRSIITKPS